MRFNKIFLTMASLAVILLLAACGPAVNSQAAQTTQIPQITIKAADYSFEAPAQLEAGLVTINLVNDGQEPHHAQILRLNEGVSLEQFQAALQQGPEMALPLAVAAGGPGIVDPGLSSQVTLDLSPGQYLLLCFVPGHDGVPHLAKGMARPFEVVAAVDAVKAAAPKADATVKLLDFSFVLPPEIKAGPQVWQVVNEGPQPHEILLIKLAEGKSMGDFQAFMQAPHGAPPFANVGGFQAIHPGETGWLHLNLTPGEYVALCYIPDEKGKPHIEHGMALPFTVK
jgi:uncharacterized cupredoxin-like copper-binding protein